MKACLLAVLYAWACWGPALAAFAKARLHAARAPYAVTIGETACQCPMSHVPGAPCCCKHMQDDSQTPAPPGENCHKLQECPGRAPAGLASLAGPGPHIFPVGPGADLPRPKTPIFVTSALRPPQVTLDPPEKIPI